MARKSRLVICFALVLALFFLSTTQASPAPAIVNPLIKSYLAPKKSVNPTRISSDTKAAFTKRVPPSARSKLLGFRPTKTKLAPWFTISLPGKRFPLFTTTKKPKWTFIPLPTPKESDPGYIPSHCLPSGLASRNPVLNKNLLECYINNMSDFTYSIRFWKNKTGADTSPYADWPASMKKELHSCFANSWYYLVSHTDPFKNWAGLPVYNDSNRDGPYQVPPGATDWVRTVWDPASQAWPYYCTLVGHQMALEVYGILPWTLRSLDWPVRHQIMSGWTMFWQEWPNPPGGAYDFVYSGGLQPWPPASTPADPVYLWRFFHKLGILKNNRPQMPAKMAVATLLDWCRWNLKHFSGNWALANMIKYFGEFQPRAVDIIEGRNYTGNDKPASEKFGHWTAGCSGTVAFLETCLRALNIPVIKLWGDLDACAHNSAWFPSIEAYLSHGDDPYDVQSKGIGDWVPEPLSLLTSKQDWLAWFNHTVQQSCTNLGRRPYEIAIDSPSLLDLWNFCVDIQAGISWNSSIADKQNSWVVKQYAFLGYDAGKLQARGVWDRLEMVRIARGGCPQGCAVSQWSNLPYCSM